MTDLGSGATRWGDSLFEVEASTGRILVTHKLSGPSPGFGSGPTLIRFRENSDPPQAYFTAMFGGADKKGSLWAAIWDKSRHQFKFEPVFDFQSTGGTLPLALKFTLDEKRLIVTSAIPGKLHVFDVAGDPLRPKLLVTLPARPGAHHIALSPDDRLAFVQNGVLNAPGFSHGSITVIDLEKLEVIDTINTFPDLNLTTNHILLLSEWD